MAYLDDHPNPNLAQQRPRRDTPTGLIVVHTAESALDASGEDTGAEGVARYISVRDTYGSYHRLADSDSVVKVARFDMTTYGDGTGSNDIAIHISAACRAADWPTMNPDRRAAYVANMAKAAAEAARWLKREHGIVVPPWRISKAESDQRKPGFISHGERDPGRRTDPGPAFPWADFLDQYAELTTEDDMADYATQLARIEAKQDKILDRLGKTAVIRASLANLRKQSRIDARDLDSIMEKLDELAADDAKG